MRKKFLCPLGITVIIISVSFSSIHPVYAGSKEMEAKKREKFKDDDVVSMKDLMDKREAESEAYKAKMLSNGDKTVVLLKEIRDLLRQMNEEKEEN